MEIVVNDADVEEIVDAIVGRAATGRIGDGKIWVTPVESVCGSGPATATTPRSDPA